jgi:hypothetical protein
MVSSGGAGYLAGDLHLPSSAQQKVRAPTEKGKRAQTENGTANVKLARSCHPSNMIFTRLSRGASKTFSFDEPSDVCALCSSLLSTLLLVLLAVLAAKASKDMDDKTNRIALPLLAASDPLDACVNGSTDPFKGTVSNEAPSLYCFGKDKMIAGKASLINDDLPIDQRRQRYSQIMMGLLDCGVFAGVYVVTDTMNEHVLFRNHNESYWKSQGKHGILDVTGDAGPHALIAQVQTDIYSTIVPNGTKPKWRYYINATWPRQVNGLLFDDMTRPGDGANVTELLKLGDALLNGIVQIKHRDDASSVWVSIRQDRNTSVCLAKHLSEGSDCGNHVEMAVIIPETVSLADYSCTDGVDDARRRNFEDIKKAVQGRLADNTFLGIRGLRTDDIWAIYTGTLAAVFSGGIVFVSTTFVTLVVTIIRSFSGQTLM